jgi:hypothetical protein
MEDYFNKTFNNHTASCFLYAIDIQICLQRAALTQQAHVEINNIVVEIVQTERLSQS